MKIARPSRPEVPFKRKRSPPPQATKLLRYSFLAGLVFMVLLAITFLPRMFPDQRPVEIVRTLRLETNPANSTRLVVEDVTNALDLALFRANLTRDGTVIASLGTGLRNGTTTLRFIDANGNGRLDSGDYFAISCVPSSTHRFEIFQVDVDRRVGFLTWTGC
jgi:hypothetical protein